MDNNDTIVAAEKRAVEIDVDFFVYSDSSAFRLMELVRVLWLPGET